MSEDDSYSPTNLGNAPIAIVGMSALFPNASDLETYWENILNKVDCLIDIPVDRWSVEDYFDKDPSAPDKTYSRKG